MIPEEKIREIQDRSDIVEIASAHLTLKKTGSSYVTLCPFHGEKTPSFNVSPSRQAYHCFGCGEGGDVISLLMKLEGMTFPDAVRKLADQCGVTIVEEQIDPEAEKRRQQRAKMVEITEAAAATFCRNLFELPEAEQARNYLEERGYDAHTARTAKIGYARNSWDALLNELDTLGIGREDAEAVGMIRKGKREGEYFDFFRNRLIFPIHGLKGDVIAFGGRAFGDDMPKYINSTDSLLFNKRQVLYGLFEGRSDIVKREEAILVEGYFDRIALDRAGYPNSVATCGTALTEEHVRTLSRYAKKVVLLFDQDAAGKKATFKSMDMLLTAKVPASVILLPQGEDPDSFIKKEGGAAFDERVKAAVPILQYFLDETLENAKEDVGGAAKAVETVLNKLKLVDSEIEKDLYVNVLVERTGVDAAACRRHLGNYRGRANRGAVQRTEQRPKSPSAARKPAASHDVRSNRRSERAQEYLLYRMIYDAEIADRVGADGVSTYFNSDPLKYFAEQVVALQPFTDSLDAIIGRFEQEYQPRLQAIQQMDPHALPEDGEIFSACRLGIERDSRLKERAEIQSEIRQQELAGNSEEVARLQLRFAELARQLKQ